MLPVATFASMVWIETCLELPFGEGHIININTGSCSSFWMFLMNHLCSPPWNLCMVYQLGFVI